MNEFAKQSPMVPSRQQLTRLALALLIIGVAGVSIWLGREGRKPAALEVSSVPEKSARTMQRPEVEAGPAPTSLEELFALAPDELDRVDIGRANLVCGLGVERHGGAQQGSSDDPGQAAGRMKGLDVDRAVALLNDWADRVWEQTQRHLYRLDDPKYAAHYRHSEAYLRAEMLVQVLYEDVGIKYNKQASENMDFADRRAVFLWGLIPESGASENLRSGLGQARNMFGGTCTSMPVLVAAVGRRLGYPIKLVLTDSHVFCRWDGEGHAIPAWRKRFNIEATNGFASYDDEYYLNWPQKITRERAEQAGYLKSLTPSEELALFVASLGHGAMDGAQPALAAWCYQVAMAHDPSRPCYVGWYRHAVETLVLVEQDQYQRWRGAMQGATVQMPTRGPMASYGPTVPRAPGPPTPEEIANPGWRAGASGSQPTPTNPWVHQPDQPFMPNGHTNPNAAEPRTAESPW